MNNFHVNPDRVVELILAYLPKLALAILTLIIGLWPIAGSRLTANSVDLAVRVWVKNSDYQDVNFSFLETVKKEFDKEEVTIPLSQMHIHVKTKS
jgi:small-conductance mechanosensitive channel